MAKKLVKKGQPSAQAYDEVLALRDRKDLLYTRITFLALRHGFELPKDDKKQQQTVKVDPQEAFVGAKALVLEDLASDVAKAIALICATECFNASACKSLVK